MSVRLLRVTLGRAAALRTHPRRRWDFGTWARLQYLRRPRGYGLALARVYREARALAEVRP